MHLEVIRVDCCDPYAEKQWWLFARYWCAVVSCSSTLVTAQMKYSTGYWEVICGCFILCSQSSALVHMLSFSHIHLISSLLWSRLKSSFLSVVWAAFGKNLFQYFSRIFSKHYCVFTIQWYLLPAMYVRHKHTLKIYYFICLGPDMYTQD